MGQSFPKFSDGDVEIHLTSDGNDNFVLHSYVLALHSTWFKASLSDRWSTSGAGVTGDTSLFGGSGRTLQEAGKKHWVYELRFEKDSADRLLMRKGATSGGELLALNSCDDSDVFDLAGYSLAVDRDRCIKAHKDMFGTLYHLPPAFSYESFDKARQSIRNLAKTADKYGCEHVVKLHVENHLRLYKTEVLDLCASKTMNMIELAMAVKSEWIFMEAATNLLGRSNRTFDATLPKLEELGIASLFKAKRAALVNTLCKCEYDILCLQPTSMSTWYTQFAVYYFRQWLTEQLTTNKGSALGPGYARIYHEINGANFAADYDASHWCSAIFTYGDNSNGVFNTSVNEVVQRAAAILEPVLKDITRRQDSKLDMFRSLRFMGIGDEELPWIKK